MAGYNVGLDISDLAKEPPEIRFHTVSSTKGFTMVEELTKNMTLGYSGSR